MSRFSDVVSRQLDMFVQDGMLDDVREAKARYDAADREEAEEAFGDYMDAVDAVKDALAEMRDSYASTLDDAAEYEDAFERAARKRWRWLG